MYYVYQVSYGMIIHPSVYFISDVYLRHGIGKSLKGFEKDISAFREQEHPEMRDPWTLLEASQRASVKACRILVCRRTGVGKSTLINRVFGVPLVSTPSMILDVVRLLQYCRLPRRTWRKVFIT